MSLSHVICANLTAGPFVQSESDLHKQPMYNVMTVQLLAVSKRERDTPTPGGCARERRRKRRMRRGRGDKSERMTEGMEKKDYTEGHSENNEWRSNAPTPALSSFISLPLSSANPHTSSSSVHHLYLCCMCFGNKFFFLA